MESANPPRRQTRHRTGVGLGIDASGGPVIDPTENVLSLVDVEKAHAHELRVTDQRHSDIIRETDLRYLKEIRTAETRRLNDLAALKALYDKQISDMLSVQVKTTSDLISTQLDKVTTALGAQITTLTAATQAQFSALTTSLGDRIAQVERFRYEWGGKASVADPATSAALESMSKVLNQLSAGSAGDAGRGIGRAEIIGWMVGIIGAAAAVITLIFFHH